jgi:hypothetical protein
MSDGGSIPLLFFIILLLLVLDTMATGADAEVDADVATTCTPPLPAPPSCSHENSKNEINSIDKIAKERKRTKSVGTRLRDRLRSVFSSRTSSTSPKKASNKKVSGNLRVFNKHQSKEESKRSLTNHQQQQTIASKLSSSCSSNRGDEESNRGDKEEQDTSRVGIVNDSLPFAESKSEGNRVEEKEKDSILAIDDSLPPVPSKSEDIIITEHSTRTFKFDNRSPFDLKVSLNPTPRNNNSSNIYRPPHSLDDSAVSLSSSHEAEFGEIALTGEEEKGESSKSPPAEEKMKKTKKRRSTYKRNSPKKACTETQDKKQSKDEGGKGSKTKRGRSPGGLQRPPSQSPGLFPTKSKQDIAESHDNLLRVLSLKSMKSEGSSSRVVQLPVPSRSIKSRSRSSGMLSSSSMRRNLRDKLEEVPANGIDKVSRVSSCQSVQSKESFQSVQSERKLASKKYRSQSARVLRHSDNVKKEGHEDETVTTTESIGECSERNKSETENENNGESKVKIPPVSSFRGVKSEGRSQSPGLLSSKLRSSRKEIKSQSESPGVLGDTVKRKSSSHKQEKGGATEKSKIDYDNKTTKTKLSCSSSNRINSTAVEKEPKEFDKNRDSKESFRRVKSEGKLASKKYRSQSAQLLRGRGTVKKDGQVEETTTTTTTTTIENMAESGKSNISKTESEGRQRTSRSQSSGLLRGKLRSSRKLSKAQSQSPGVLDDTGRRKSSSHTKGKGGASEKGIIDYDINDSKTTKTKLSRSSSNGSLNSDGSRGHLPEKMGSKTQWETTTTTTTTTTTEKEIAIGKVDTSAPSPSRSTNRPGITRRQSPSSLRHTIDMTGQVTRGRSPGSLRKSSSESRVARRPKSLRKITPDVSKTTTMSSACE